MSASLYIAAMEPSSGKSLVTLGVMELLSRRVEKLGFFRPVVRSRVERDDHIELMRRRYPVVAQHDQLFAVAHDEARQMVADGSQNDLLKLILDRYRGIRQDCDFVVCEGTDFSGP